MGLFGNKQDRAIKRAIKQLNKLTDSQQAAFAEAALNEQYLPVNLRAVERLTDQMLLAKVAIHGSGKIRSAALEKLNDSQALACVAKEMCLPNDYHTAQSELFSLFTRLNTKNYPLVKEIYTSAVDTKIRQQAEEYVAELSTDEDELIAIAKTVNLYQPAHEKAIAKISRQDALYEIAMRGSCPAIAKLTDVARLTEIVRTCTDFRMREAAIRSPHFTDQEELAAIAVKGDYSIRQDAYKNPNLQDPALLAYVFRESDVPCWRDLDPVTDRELLADIAQNGKHYKNQQTALRKIAGWEDIPWAAELNKLLLKKEAEDEEDTRIARLMAADSY